MRDERLWGDRGERRCVSRPEEEGASKTWSVSLPHLPEGTSGRRLRTIKGHFLMPLGTHLCRRSPAQEARRTLPWCLPPPSPPPLAPPHTPHDSGASPSSWVTRQGPQSPRHSQSKSARNQARCQSRTVSLQSLCSSGWHTAHPTHPPTCQGTGLSHHSAQGPSNGRAYDFDPGIVPRGPRTWLIQSQVPEGPKL